MKEYTVRVLYNTGPLSYEDFTIYAEDYYNDGNREGNSVLHFHNGTGVNKKTIAVFPVLNSIILKIK